MQDDHYLARKGCTQSSYLDDNISKYLCVISCLLHEVNYLFSLLGYYAAYGGNSLTDVSGQSVIHIFKGQVLLDVMTLGDGTDRFCRSVGK